MKKLLILFVAVFALSFVAESAFAQGLLSGRLRQNSNSDVAAVPVVAPSGGSEFSGDKIAVHRRTLCHEYRQIGWICADSLCEIPDGDYILVKRYCFGGYYWVEHCPTDHVGL